MLENLNFIVKMQKNYFKLFKPLLDRFIKFFYQITEKQCNDKCDEDT